jgi:hypothetical protein
MNNWIFGHLGGKWSICWQFYSLKIRMRIVYKIAVERVMTKIVLGFKAKDE